MTINKTQKWLIGTVMTATWIAFMIWRFNNLAGLLRPAGTNIIYQALYHATIWGLTAQCIALVLVLIATPIFFLVRRQKRLAKAAVVATEKGVA